MFQMERYIYHHYIVVTVSGVETTEMPNSTTAGQEYFVLKYICT